MSRWPGIQVHLGLLWFTPSVPCNANSSLFILKNVLGLMTNYMFTYGVWKETQESPWLMNTRLRNFFTCPSTSPLEKPVLLSWIFGRLQRSRQGQGREELMWTSRGLPSKLSSSANPPLSDHFSLLDGLVLLLGESFGVGEASILFSIV